MNLQDNLKTFITKEVKNNQRVFKIVDKKHFPQSEAHVFYKGVVTDWGDTKEAFVKMGEAAHVNYCDWYAKNKNVVRKFYENKTN